MSTDRIAYGAMRVARLVGKLGVTDRSGAGRIAEVYPAAALKSWGLSWRLYKGVTGRAARSGLLQQLRKEAPYLEGGEEEWECLELDDNVFDALICALVARAVARQLSREIPPEHRTAARIEGWIHIPQPGSLQNLLA